MTRAVQYVDAGTGAPVQWGQPLPPGFRPDANERVIELPLAWLLAERSPLTLDTGCGFNHQNIERHCDGHLVHLTRGGEDAFRHPRRHYVAGDLRALPFADRAFPLVLCISTLEHVGMDNRTYGGVAEDAPETMLDAVRELRRVARGNLMLSFPYGQAARHPSGRFRVFGPADLSSVLRTLQPATTSVFYYQRTPEGWRLVGTGLGTLPGWLDEKTITGLCVVLASIEES